MSTLYVRTSSSLNAKLSPILIPTTPSFVLLTFVAFTTLSLPPIDAPSARVTAAPTHVSPAASFAVISTIVSPVGTSGVCVGPGVGVGVGVGSSVASPI